MDYYEAEPDETIISVKEINEKINKDTYTVILIKTNKQIMKFMINPKMKAIFERDKLVRANVYLDDIDNYDILIGDKLNYVKCDDNDYIDECGNKMDSWQEKRFLIVTDKNKFHVVFTQQEDPYTLWSHSYIAYYGGHICSKHIA